MAVNTAQFQKAMNAALDGPEVKKIKPDKHEFNVKKVRVESDANGIVIHGDKGHHISHHLTLRDDDQVYFSARVDKTGAVSELSVNIDRSWANRGVALLADAVLDRLIGKKSDGGATTAPAKDSEKLLDGSWEGEAKFLIANIIVHAAARHLPGVTVTAPGSVPVSG